LVHVSTAFNNLDREELDEVIYSSNTIDTVKLIELIDCLDDGTVRAITKEYKKKKSRVGIQILIFLK